LIGEEKQVLLTEVSKWKVGQTCAVRGEKKKKKQRCGGWGPPSGGGLWGEGTSKDNQLPAQQRKGRRTGRPQIKREKKKKWGETEKKTQTGKGKTKNLSQSMASGTQGAARKGQKVRRSKSGFRKGGGKWGGMGDPAIRRKVRESTCLPKRRKGKCDELDQKRSTSRLKMSRQRGRETILRTTGRVGR